MVTSPDERHGSNGSGLPTICVWDQDDDRAIAVTAALSGYSEARRYSLSSQLDSLIGSCFDGVALFGLASDRLSAFERDTIARLRQLHFVIIAYGAGASRWPLGARCGPFAAGCAELLDCAREDFAADLQPAVSVTLRAQAERRAGDDCLRDRMRGYGIVASTDAMLDVFRRVVRVSAMSDLPVLITGETGTGKELFARAIHALDARRRAQPFVAVNCGAIVKGIAESELFGHRRGAFTGADRSRKGFIRSADTGVLFLDEASELDPATQVKLLRVLQDKRVVAVGEDSEVPVDLRVVAATNRRLDEMVEAGRFRADLYHRLNVLSIHLPPLRERREDIAPLVEYFLRRYAPVGPASAHTAEPEFLEAVARLDLPGNVRQLENLVRRALVDKCSDGPLRLRDLPREGWEELTAKEAAPPAAAAPLPPITPDLPDNLGQIVAMSDWNLARTLGICERSILKASLRLSAGNHAQTARMLGIAPRTLFNKIRKHDLLT